MVTGSFVLTSWRPSAHARWFVRIVYPLCNSTSIGPPDFNQYAGGVTLPNTDNLPSPTNRTMVNNAGIISVGPLDSQQLEDFKEAMDVMFWGPVHCTLTVLPVPPPRALGPRGAGEQRPHPGCGRSVDPQPVLQRVAVGAAERAGITGQQHQRSRSGFGVPGPDRRHGGLVAHQHRVQPFAEQALGELGVPPARAHEVRQRAEHGGAETLPLAQQRLSRRGQADALAMPFPDASFAGAYSMNVSMKRRNTSGASVSPGVGTGWASTTMCREGITTTISRVAMEPVSSWKIRRVAGTSSARTRPSASLAFGASRNNRSRCQWGGGSATD